MINDKTAMGKRKQLMVFLIICFLGACNFITDRNKNILERCEILLEVYPDSALVLLDSIYFPEELKDKQLYHYILLKIQAKDKSYQNIKEDTLIFTTKKYYSKNKDVENMALATFYCGRLLHERKDLEYALSEYLEASESIENIKNDRLKALIYTNIGYIYYEQLLMDKAKSYYIEADKFFNANDNAKNKALINSYIGNILLLEDKTDSAMYYYNKGFDIARKYSLENIQSVIKQNIGLSYQNKNEYEQAKKYYSEALNSCIDSVNRARIIYNIGYVHTLQNNNDSALFYMKEAISLVPDTSMYFLQANMYKGLSTVYESKGDHRKVVQYTQYYANSIKNAFKENQAKAIYDIEKKYNYEILKNKQNQLKLEQQNIINIALFIIVTLIILAFILNHERKKEKNTRIEGEKKILYLQNMADNFNDRENTFRSRLLKHFNILKKSALLKGVLSEDEILKGKRLLKKFNEIVYGQEDLDWNMLYNTMNELHDGYFDILRDNYPLLNESEFKICSLIYADFTNEEIAIIMNLAASSITKKRSSIRKKIGLEEYASIRDFLINKVK